MKHVRYFRTIDDAVNFFQENEINRKSFKDFEGDMDELEKWVEHMKQYPHMGYVEVDIHYKKLYFTFNFYCLVFDESGSIERETLATGSGEEYDYGTFLAKKRSVWFNNVASYPGLAYMEHEHSTLSDIVA